VPDGRAVSAVKWASAKVASPEGSHHRLIGSLELWRRTRVFLIYAALVMLVGEGINVFGDHSVVPEYLVTAVVLLAAAAAIYWRQRTHFVELGAEGIRLCANFKSVELAYEQVRQSRCQPVQKFFDTPARRDLLSGTLKRFSSRPACIIKVDQDHERLLVAGHMLGRGTVVDQELIMMVDGAESLDKALQARIRRRPAVGSPKPSLL
jgi:hypothetical protein